MKILIKILNESHLYHSLNLEGISGKPYAFLWNKTLDSYTYEPKGQEEINDIFATQGVICPWHLSPIIIEGEMSEGGQAKPLTIPPYLSRKLYENHSDAELVALAADVGLTLQGARERDNMLRQLDAYMAGRSWGAKHPVELPAVPAPAEPVSNDTSDQAAKIAELERQLASSKKANGTLRATMAKVVRAKFKGVKSRHSADEGEEETVTVADV